MARLLPLLAVIVFVSTVSVVADGKSVYNSKCVSCHSKDGKGNKKMSSTVKGDMTKLDLTDKASADKSDVELRKVIEGGLNKMPAYKKKLTAEEITHVIRYVRTLQKAK